MKRLVVLFVALALTACGGDGAEEPIPVEPDGGIGDGAGPPGDGFVGADLTITIEHPDAATVEYRVACSDGTATVDGFDGLSPEAACARLAIPEVQERLIDPPLPGDRVCTEIYGGPDTAHIRGTLDDQSVDTIIDRTNGCGISDWDTVLVDVLPPALGVTG
jgi:hypothetical protein